MNQRVQNLQLNTKSHQKLIKEAKEQSLKKINSKI